jgi:hypothetical protein
MDVNHRPRRASPENQQFQHAQLCLGVVARPKPGVKNAFLLIDEDQRCVVL